MLTRKEVTEIMNKIENNESAADEETLSKVYDLAENVIDAYAGINSIDHLMGTKDYSDLVQALDMLETCMNLMNVDTDQCKNLTDVRDKFELELEWNCHLLECSIYETDLELPKSLGWEDYDQWNEDFSKKCEEFEHLWEEDKDKWDDAYRTAQAKEFMKHPRMWIYDNNVYVPGLAESKDDKIRKYIAKNTVWPQIKKEFAAYA